MTNDSQLQEPTRLNIPRHLQDFNGYCGPACALMLVDFAGSAKSPPVYAQAEYFKEIRHHAKESRDRRPIKSPAESLLEMVNAHTSSSWEWTKIFDSDPHPVAQQVFASIVEKQQPCLILVSKGMHWVVAFGVLRNELNEPTGLLMRDPAWTGMPKFYGLSIFPDEPRVHHGPAPCSCMESDGENSPGTIHERFFTTSELLTHRGLQGAPDHEGKGAIALVPPQSGIAAFALPVAAASPVANAKDHAGEAALAAVRQNGLCGSPSSPPEWDKALSGAVAGDPILVKDPEDSRDDFFLVPLTPKNPTSNQAAWAMLDARTLQLREVSLLESWSPPTFPDPDKDTKQLSDSPITLADGTVAKFKPTDITTNTTNLAWTPSAASILPYWPVKEFTVPHPKTGKPEKIYLTQENNYYPSLSPEEPQLLGSKSPTPKKGPGKLLKTLAGAAAVAGGIMATKHFLEDSPPPPPPSAPEIIILETFENGQAGVTDTGQKWSDLFFPEREGKAIVTVEAKRHFSTIRNISFLPESTYKLDVEVLMPTTKYPEFAFGFSDNSRQGAQKLHVILRQAMVNGLPRTVVSLVGTNSPKKEKFAPGNPKQSVTLLLQTGSNLNNSQISIQLNGKPHIEPTRCDASLFNGIFIAAYGHHDGKEISVESITLTRLQEQ